MNDIKDLAIADNLPDIKNETGVAAAAAREQFAIQASFVTAKRFPRDENASFLKLMKTYERPSAALGAEYSFPRGGKNINGPSVNLARQAARCWGNIRSGFSVVAVDEQDVHLKGEALDLETNTYAQQESKFKKKVQRKNKQSGRTEWVEPDERDLRELVNKHGAILERNCILRLIPRDIIDEAVLRARSTLVKASKGELETNKEDTIRALLKSFSGIGVTQEMLEEHLDHKIDLINEEQLADLRQKYASIKSGETTREEHFEIPKSKSQEAVDGLTAELKNISGKEKAK